MDKISENDSVLATVTICTRDRAASLRVTLSSILIAAHNAVDPWEIQIVDNGSKDDTAAVIESFKDRLPIRRVYESTPGLSNARNAGIAAARGQYIIWTDDDVEVDENWLVTYLAAFKTNKEYALFGGTALPVYKEPVSQWFVDSEPYLQNLLAIRNNRDWTAINPEQLPYGLNYAVKTDVQRKHRYDPDLGVAPGRRRGGEEVAMLRAALADGAIGIWLWDAKVKHLIPAERQTLQYIKQYYRAAGYDYFFDTKGMPWRLGKVPVRLYRNLAARALITVVQRGLGKRKWVHSYMLLSLLQGIRDRYITQ